MAIAWKMKGTAAAGLVEIHLLDDGTLNVATLPALQADNVGVMMLRILAMISLINAMSMTKFELEKEP